MIMFRHIRPAILFSCILSVALLSGLSAPDVFAQQGYGQQWARTGNAQDFQRYYHYPYVYYPHNYYSPEYLQSGPNPYNRYPAEMQVPAYNKSWMNFYPSSRRYHSGHHFRLDIF